jgi:radical SAM protein with 4Fe4S-binding SPASM domain
MTWHSRYRTPELQARLSLEERFPYLSALLNHPASLAAIAERRAHNYKRARAAEIAQPQWVEPRPYHVVLDPASRCNLQCPLCVQATNPNGRPRTLAEPEMMFRVLNEIAPHAIRLDLFNWGEPLLNPALPSLIKKASGCGLYTRTSTNLSLALPRGTIETVVRSGISSIVVSIDGATQDVYSNYRKGGRLDVVLDNLRAMLQIRNELGSITPVIEWQFLALAANVHEIEIAAELASDIGVDVFRFGGARGVMASKVTESVANNFARSKHILLDTSHPLSEYREDGDKLHPAEKTSCKWLWGKLAIQADGGVSPCWSAWFTEADHGNVQHASLAELWNNERFQRARASAVGPGSPNGPTVCDSCAFHGAFVNPPDRPEATITPTDAFELAAVLTAMGLAPAADTLNAVVRGLSDGDPIG